MWLMGVEKCRKECVLMLTEDYQPNNIYFADETGLSFRLAHMQTWVWKELLCISGKNSTERIMVLVASNVNDINTIPSLVTGWSVVPLLLLWVACKRNDFCDWWNISSCATLMSVNISVILRWHIFVMLPVFTCVLKSQSYPTYNTRYNRLHVWAKLSHHLAFIRNIKKILKLH